MMIVSVLFHMYVLEAYVAYARKSSLPTSTFSDIMGICMSAEDKANAAQAAASQKLDRELEAARDKESKTVKLLLLGMLL